MEPSSSSEAPFNSDVPRPTVGSRRVSEAIGGDHSADASPSPSGVFSPVFDTLGALPMHSSELGQLPLHHEVKYPTNFNFQEMRTDVWNATENTARLSPTVPMQTSPSAVSGQDGQYNWNPPFDYDVGNMTGFGGSASGSFPQGMSEFGGSTSFGSQSQAPQLQQQQISQPGQTATQFAPPLLNGVSAGVQPEFLNTLFQQPPPAKQPEQMFYEQHAEAYMHKDTLQMWSNAPTGFEYVFY